MTPTISVFAASIRKIETTLVEIQLDQSALKSDLDDRFHNMCDTTGKQQNELRRLSEQLESMSGINKESEKKLATQSCGTCKNLMAKLEALQARVNHLEKIRQDDSNPATKTPLVPKQTPVKQATPKQQMRTPRPAYSEAVKSPKSPRAASSQLTVDTQAGNNVDEKSVTIITVLT